MEKAIARFKEIIADVDADIEEADVFKADLMANYGIVSIDIDSVIKIQSMVLKISDYISQKRITKAELERQLADYEQAYEKQLKGE